MTKNVSEEFSMDHVKHVVGIDRGIRFLVTSYDEKGKVTFVSGKEIQKSENTFSRYVQSCSQRAQNQQNVH